MNAARTYRAAGDAYRVQDVSTAGPGQLVVLLYDGALDAIAKAERALVQSEAGDDGRDRYTTAHDQLSRAQAILTELQLSLDHDLGGEIAGPPMRSTATASSASWRPTWRRTPACCPRCSVFSRSCAMRSHTPPPRPALRSARRDGILGHVDRPVGRSAWSVRACVEHRRTGDDVGGESMGFPSQDAVPARPHTGGRGKARPAV